MDDTIPGDKNRNRPTVPTVLTFRDRLHAYKVASLVRWRAIYHTEATVRVEHPDDEHLASKYFHQLYAIATEADWQRLVNAHQRFQQALDGLASVLRDLGRYDKRLEEAGGFKSHPNILSATAIFAPDPDAADSGTPFYNDPWRIPNTHRYQLVRHTSKMLAFIGASGTVTMGAQHHCFICPDDDAWARVQAARTVIVEAEQAWTNLLTELGHYDPQRVPVAILESDAGSVIEAVNELPLTHVFKRPAEVPAIGKIPLDRVLAGPWQPRKLFNEDSLKAMAESISEHGLQNRILVVHHAGYYFLVGGERRTRASRIAGLVEIDAEIKEMTAQQAWVIGLLDNLEREELTPIEEGMALAKLVEIEGSESAVERKLKRPRSYIKSRILIARSAPELHEALAKPSDDKGGISVTVARYIAEGAPDDHRTQRLALRQVQEKLRAGRRLSEAEIRREAENAALKNHKATLEALGWHIAEQHDGRPVFWSDADMPTEWSGLDILDAVRQERRPTPVKQIDEPLTDEEWSWLRARGIQNYWGREYAPWVRVDQPGAKFWSRTQARQLAGETQTLLEQYQRDLATKGWTLEVRHGHWSIVSANNRKKTAYKWDDGVAIVEAILSGALAESDQDAKTTPCIACSKPATDYCQILNGKACAACATAAEEKYKAEERAISEAIAQTIAPALAAASDQALRLILLRSCISNYGAPTNSDLLGISGNARAEETLAAITNADHDLLLRATIGALQRSFAGRGGYRQTIATWLGLEGIGHAEDDEGDEAFYDDEGDEEEFNSGQDGDRQDSAKPTLNTELIAALEKAGYRHIGTFERSGGIIAHQVQRTWGDDTAAEEGDDEVITLFGDAGVINFLEQDDLS
jgi:ParB family chromosome partitioning protein